MRKLTRDHGLGLAHFDGCAVGVEASRGVLARKPWTVGTTRPLLRQALEKLRCTGDHPHGQLSGAAATRSGHDTTMLCDIVLESIGERGPDPADAASNPGMAPSVTGKPYLGVRRLLPAVPPCLHQESLVSQKDVVAMFCLCRKYAYPSRLLFLSCLCLQR